MIERKPGTVMPNEYDWESQFSLNEVIEAFAVMDVGKVRGLAIAYQELEGKIYALEQTIDALTGGKS